MEMKIAFRRNINVTAGGQGAAFSRRREPAFSLQHIGEILGGARRAFALPALLQSDEILAKPGAQRGRNLHDATGLAPARKPAGDKSSGCPQGVTLLHHVPRRTKKL